MQARIPGRSLPRHLAAVGVAALLLCVASAEAQPARDDRLFKALGGEAGIVALMADFVPRLAHDAKIGHFFKYTQREHLARQLAAQVCQLSGGPCTYEGPSMGLAHEGMGVRRADFNRLVELLQLSMEARGLPFGEQNRLLALLAPMHRDIVERE